MVFRLVTVLTCAVAFSLGCQAGENEPAAAASVESAETTPAGTPSGSGDSSVVARIGDEAVTLEELDTWIKDDLYDRETSGGNPSKAYELRSDALRRMITTRVVEGEAARRNTTSEAMIMGDVAAMGEVSDAEVEAFYNEQGSQVGTQTLEELSPRIRNYLQQLRGQQAVEKMIDDAGVVFLLEQPRVDVAAIGPSKGPADARVTIIEFSDFECPFCSRALPVLEEVMALYPDDVRLVYRHLPLERIHARARPAAEASLCADEQGKFWAYHDLLFANARALSDDDLKKYAEDSELDVAAWSQCMEDDRTNARIDADLEAGQAVGVTGTPAFIVNGVIISGARPLPDFVELIDAELAGG
jgi:protein-disulfide isomerase